MDSRHYAFAPGEPARLVLSWGTNYSFLNIKLDGTTIGKVNSAGELMRGAQFFLPDGEVLHIKLVKQVGNSDLVVTLDGKPLKAPGLAKGNRDLLEAYQAVMGIGVLNLISFVFTLDSTTRFSEVRWYTLCFAVAFFVLGWLVKGGSGVALTFAVVMYFVETTFITLAIFTLGAYGAIPGLFVRFFLFFVMIRGYGSWEQAKESFRLFARMITEPSDKDKPKRDAHVASLTVSSGGPVALASPAAPIPFADPFSDPTPQRESFVDPFLDSPADMDTAVAESPLLPFEQWPPQARQVHHLLREAAAMYREGEPREQARKLVKDAIQLAPTLADCWYVVAALVEKRSDRVRALEKAIQYDPAHLGAGHALAQLRRGQAFIDGFKQQP
jgi:hypothetical protein